MEWNVLIGDFNSGEIESYNVFRHSGFVRDVAQTLRKFSASTPWDAEGLENELNRILRYYFWSKCEWEIVVSHWPPCPKNKKLRSEKVDVYSQVMLNWDVFYQYLLQHRDALLEAAT